MVAMLKIVGGIARGRILKIPKGRDIRPTSNRVREALFDVLGKKAVEAEVLDLFCGSGALGIEALSRGAGSCVFVDRSRRCITAVRENLTAVKLPAKTEILHLEVTAAIGLLARKKRKFDLILLDPPYHRNLGTKTLRSLSLYDILKRTGMVVVEHYQKDRIFPAGRSLVLRRRLAYGETVLSFFQKGEKGEKKGRLSGQL